MAFRLYNHQREARWHGTFSGDWDYSPYDTDVTHAQQSGLVQVITPLGNITAEVVNLTEPLPAPYNVAVIPDDYGLYFQLWIETSLAGRPAQYTVQRAKFADSHAVVSLAGSSWEVVCQVEAGFLDGVGLVERIRPGTTITLTNTGTDLYLICEDPYNTPESFSTFPPGYTRITGASGGNGPGTNYACWLIVHSTATGPSETVARFGIIANWNGASLGVARSLTGYVGGYVWDSDGNIIPGETSGTWVMDSTDGIDLTVAKTVDALQVANGPPHFDYSYYNVSDSCYCWAQVSPPWEMEWSIALKNYREPAAGETVYYQGPARAARGADGPVTLTLDSTHRPPAEEIVLDGVGEHSESAVTLQNYWWLVVSDDTTSVHEFWRWDYQNMFVSAREIPPSFSNLNSYPSFLWMGKLFDAFQLTSDPPPAAEGFDPADWYIDSSDGSIGGSAGAMTITATAASATAFRPHAPPGRPRNFRYWQVKANINHARNISFQFNDGRMWILPILSGGIQTFEVDFMGPDDVFPLSVWPTVKNGDPFKKPPNTLGMSIFGLQAGDVLTLESAAVVRKDSCARLTVRRTMSSEFSPISANESLLRLYNDHYKTLEVFIWPGEPQTVFTSYVDTIQKVINAINASHSFHAAPIAAAAGDFSRDSPASWVGGGWAIYDGGWVEMLDVDATDLTIRAQQNWAGPFCFFPGCGEIWGAGYGGPTPLHGFCVLKNESEGIVIDPATRAGSPDVSITLTDYAGVDAGSATTESDGYWRTGTPYLWSRSVAQAATVAAGELRGTFWPRGPYSYFTWFLLEAVATVSPAGQSSWDESQIEEKARVRADDARHLYFGMPPHPDGRGWSETDTGMVGENPTLRYDGDINNTLLLVYQRDGDVFQRETSDEGKTWSDETLLASARIRPSLFVTEDGRRVYAWIDPDDPASFLGVGNVYHQPLARGAGLIGPAFTVKQGNPSPNIVYGTVLSRIANPTGSWLTDERPVAPFAIDRPVSVGGYGHTDGDYRIDVAYSLDSGSRLSRSINMGSFEATEVAFAGYYISMRATQDGTRYVAWRESDGLHVAVLSPDDSQVVGEFVVVAGIDEKGMDVGTFNRPDGGLAGGLLYTEEGAVRWRIAEDGVSFVE
jgi:hypothetical protein